MSSLNPPTIVELVNLSDGGVNIQFSSNQQISTDGSSPTVASISIVVPNTNFSKTMDSNEMAMSANTFYITLADLAAGGLRSGTFSFDLFFTDSNDVDTSVVSTDDVTRNIQPYAPTNASFATPEDWSMNNKIYLSWSYESMDQQLTGYKIYNDVGSPPITLDTMNMNVEIELNSSYSGKTPKFSIVAVNSLGESDPLEITFPYVINADFNLPTAPQNLAIVLSGGVAHVTWDLPADTGGVITGYNLSWTDALNELVGSNNQLGATAVAYDVTGLSLESYIFTISAKNSLGSGASITVSVNASTPVSSNLVITQNTDGIVLSWTGIPAASLNSYEVSSTNATTSKRTTNTTVSFTRSEINASAQDTITFILTTEYNNPSEPFSELEGSLNFTGWPVEITYDASGWSSDPSDMINNITKTLYDNTGFNRSGWDIEGYDREGYNEDGYNRSGYNSGGFNVDGWNTDGINERTGTIYDENGFEVNGNRRPEISSFTAEVVPFQGIKLTWSTTTPGTMESFLITIGSFSRTLAFGNGVQDEVTLITVDDLMGSISNLLTPAATLTFAIGIQFADGVPPQASLADVTFNGFGLLAPSLSASFTDSLYLDFVAPALLFGEITLYKLTSPDSESLLIEPPLNISDTSSEVVISVNDLVAYGFTNGSYTLVLTATDSYGQTSSSSASVDIVLAPPAPTNVTAYKNGTEIFVEWESEFSCRVYRNGTDVAFGDNSASFQITSEDYNQEYTYNVVAENDYGSSTGVEVTLAIIGAIKEPSEPTNVLISPKNNGALLTWEMPTDTGNEITGYTININDGSSTIDLSADPSTYEYRITGLTNGIGYTVDISSTNSLGSSPVVSNNLIPVKTVPDTPVVLFQRGDKTIKLLLEAPDNGGHPITGYRIQKYLVSDSSQLPDENGYITPFDVVYEDVATITNLAYTVTGLTLGSTYKFRVFAANTLGDSLPAISAQLTVYGVPSVPLNFRTFEINEAERRISTLWDDAADDGGSAITGYLFATLYNGVVQLEVLLSPGIFNTKAEQLDANVNVTYTVCAVNEIGNSALVTLGPFRFGAGDPTGVPLAPSDITVVPAAASALVSWVPPSDSGITGYKIFCNPDNKLPNLAAAGATSLNVTGLKNGTGYTFAVVAINATGSSYTASCTPSTLPGAPKATVVGGNGQVTLSWVSKPAVGVPTTSYTVTCNQTDAILPENPTTPLLITGLTNGRSYIFSVTATNAIGTSVAGAAKPVVPTSVPGVPTNFVVQAGIASFQVTWSPPLTDGGLALAGYEITYTGGGKTVVAKAKPISPYTLMVTKLVAGTEYSVSMVARNKVGASLVTQTAVVVIPPTIVRA